MGTTHADTEAPAPLISHLTITGYQSLHDISLALAPFTVIVGPSSSGKSALVRALRTLTANQRGTAFITTGFKNAKITALIDDTAVTLRRSTGTKAEDNAYSLTTPDGTDLFTKLNGEVPEEIRKALGLPNDPALTFAGQFDKPYLLDASPNEVARALASLTNVHVIFEASRNANRERLSSAATLRTRTTDLESIHLRAEEFKNLAHQRAKQEQAEETLAAARQVTTRLDNLTSALSRLTLAHQTMDATHTMASTPVPSLESVERTHADIGTLGAATYALTNALDVLESSRPYVEATIPVLDAVEAAQARLSAYHAVLVRLRDTKAAVKHWGEQHTQALIDWGNEQDAYVGALVALRTCPTCGQTTDHVDPEKIHA